MLIPPAAAASAPTAVSVTPNSGSGTTQTFSFLLSDAAGANKITYAQALINRSLAWQNSCAVLYYQSSNRLYLVQDSGAGWQGPLTPGQAGTLSNSQCTLDGGASSVSAVGNNLTVNAALTFKPAFGGNKTVFLDAEDTANSLSSGFHALGTWAVPISAPTAVSVTPSSGSGISQTFSFLFSDASGANKITYVQALIKGSLSWPNSCAVLYYQSSNRLYLVKDAGNGWQGPLTPGQAGTLSNSQCTLDAGASSVSAVGNNLTVNAALSFKPAFGGSKTVYLDAEDTASSLSSGFQTLGSWAVPVSAPMAVSVTPSSGSGTTQTFSFLASDAGGAGAITYVQALINGSLSWYHACAVLYYRSTNRLYLVNDAGNGWQGPLTPGQAGTLSNSQCTLNGVGSSVSAVGNNLTVSAALSFKTAFGGNKTVYLDAEDTANGLSSGFQTLGSWNAPSVPAAVSVTPSTGSGMTQTFAFLFSDASGANKITYVQALINGSLSWPNSCAVLYYQSSNRLYLVQDSGAGWQGPLTPGQAGTLSNSQCTLDGGASSVSAVGNNLTVNAALTFKPAFGGNKTVFLDAEDTANGLSSGFQTLGSWTVSSPDATVTSLSPSSHTAGSGSFILTINGTNFVSTAVVLWNGSNCNCGTFVSGNQLTAAIPGSYISAAGTYAVSIQNPGQSPTAAMDFTVYASGTAPTATLTLYRVNNGPSAATANVSFNNDYDCDATGTTADYLGNTTAIQCAADKLDMVTLALNVQPWDASSTTVTLSATNGSLVRVFASQPPPSAPGCTLVSDTAVALPLTIDTQCFQAGAISFHAEGLEAGAAIGQAAGTASFTLSAQQGANSPSTSSASVEVGKQIGIRLTFDDGPDSNPITDATSNQTNGVLSVLSSSPVGTNIPATFFTQTNLPFRGGSTIGGQLIGSEASEGSLPEIHTANAWDSSCDSTCTATCNGNSSCTLVCSNQFACDHISHCARVQYPGYPVTDISGNTVTGQNALESDLVQGKAQIKSLTNGAVVPTLVRAPYEGLPGGDPSCTTGLWNTVLDTYAADDVQLTQQNWDVDSGDTTVCAGTNATLACMQNQLTNGSPGSGPGIQTLIGQGRTSMVVLFHDVSASGMAGSNMQQLLIFVQKAVRYQGRNEVFELAPH